MKFFIIALAFVACAYADVSELGYDYQQPAASAPIPAPAEPEISYIPPAPEPAPAPVNTYIPPPQPQPAPAPAPINTYIPPEQHQAPTEQIEQIAQDGYRYKTARRVVYRRRT